MSTDVLIRVGKMLDAALDKIDEADIQLAKAKKDSARLDWIAENATIIKHDARQNKLSLAGNRQQLNDIIDAAMSQETAPSKD